MPVAFFRYTDSSKSVKIGTEMFFFFFFFLISSDSIGYMSKNDPGLNSLRKGLYQNSFRYAAVRVVLAVRVSQNTKTQRADNVVGGGETSVLGGGMRTVFIFSTRYVRPHADH
jgi:hypothetical protein